MSAKFGLSPRVNRACSKAVNRRMPRSSGWRAATDGSASLSWQPTHRRCKIGCTSRRKLHVRGFTSPFGGVTADGLRRTICSGRAVTDGFSWHPMQLTYSPGIPTVHDRISWTARPSASSGWMEMGRFTGASKNTLPSDVTGAVPRTYFMS